MGRKLLIVLVLAGVAWWLYSADSPEQKAEAMRIQSCIQDALKATGMNSRVLLRRCDSLKAQYRERWGDEP
jgi:hypothetical protein